MDNKLGTTLLNGTNEIEIVEFTLANQTFGINVFHVIEIMNPVKTLKVPHSHPHIEGIIELRGEVLPVVDVALALGFQPSGTPEDDKFIVAELHSTKIVFHVHGVSQIRRIHEQNIEVPSQVSKGLEEHITGIVRYNDTMIQLVSFERIISNIANN